MEYILFSVVLCYFFLKATAPQSERNRELDRELARLERESKLMEDPDYWKEAHRIEGWDDDFIYNKFNVHIFTELGAGAARRMKIEREIRLEQEMLMFPEIFRNDKNQQ